ncbi:MAG: phosphoesterase [Pseudonocardiales bacterium]|nr:phosphoesterase [Pseudonocardiales bacterium]
MNRSHRLRLAVVSLAVVAAAVGVTASSTGSAASTVTRPAYVPAIKHVFVINIENKGYDATWGPTSAAPYLSQTLRSKGVLLNTYYGTAHNSQPNYVAQISGQGPNLQMQLDCQLYSQFVQLGTVAPGQALGTGCVFPASVPSLPTQMSAAGLSWKGYMEDMGTPCRHPALNAQDTTQSAHVGDQYAVRHNPFMYFTAITSSPTCAQDVVDLSALTTDLAAVSTTPNLSYITPNLCNDGHDAPCVDGRPGGLASVDAWLAVWVPKILASPAYQADGMLVITADEADSPVSDASACCGEGPSLNAPLPGIVGLGGGRVGALVLSHWTSGGTWSTTPYNHYSLLASLEDVYGLPYLGYAQTSGLNRFGLDVYNNWKPA